MDSAPEQIIVRCVHGPACRCGRTPIYRGGLCKSCWKREYSRYQRGLFEDIPAMAIVNPKVESRRIQDRFEAFDRANPHVWQAIQRLAQDFLQRKFRRISINMIFELLRCDYSMKTGGDDYKLNNTFRALYARKLDAQPWMPAGTIEIRTRRTP